MPGSVTPDRRRKDAWKLRVPLGVDVQTGKRRVASRTVTATSKRGATKLLEEFAREVLAKDRARTVVTVSVLLDRWLELAARDRSPTTLYTYRGYIRREILPVIGAMPVGEVTAEHLDRLYSALLAKGMQPGSIRQVHAIIRRAYMQAIKWEWVTNNPAVLTTPPTVRTAQLQPPTPAMILELIRRARTDDPQFASLLLFAAATGARRGEICALRWSHVDLELGTATISRAIVDIAGHITEKDTKTHAVRSIALPPVVVADLTAQRERVTTRAGRFHMEQYVWPAPFDVGGMNPWRPDLITGAFRRLARDAGMQARFHDLRHAAATQLLAAGADVRTVSGRLGHAKASTTLDIYSHWVPAADRAAANLLGNLLAGATLPASDKEPS